MRHHRLLLVANLFPLFLASQSNYLFQHLTTEDGLSSNLRVNGYQDKQGYYWFGSTSGIQRFDGKNFITYPYTENNDRNSLAEWSGHPIEDKMSNILIVSEDGVNVYQRVNHTLVRSYNQENNDSNSNNVIALVKGSANKLWEITQRSVSQYDCSKKTAILYAPILSGERNYIIKAVIDQEKDICWLLLMIQGVNHIGWFDLRNKQFAVVANASLDHFLISNKELAFFNIDKHRNLWLADYGGNLSRYQIDSGLFKIYPIYKDKGISPKTPSHYVINDFLDDENGNIWFGGESSGLLKFDVLKNSFTRIEKDNGSAHGLHYDQTIYSFFMDRERNIWIDTDQGMNIFNPSLQHFNYVKNVASLPAEFYSSVLCIFESSTKEIWIGTGGYGLFKFDSNLIYQHNYVYQNGNSSSLGDKTNSIWSLGEDQQKRIWIGAYRGVISILDPTTEKFENKEVQAFCGSTIMHLLRDSLNNFWFGLYNGKLGKYNSKTSEFTSFNIPYTDNRKIATIIDGLTIKNNKVLISTSMNGLWIFNADKQSVEAQLFSAQHIFNLHSINDSVLIGGTAGKGVFILNEKTHSSHFVNIHDGLTSDIVYSAFPEKTQYCLDFRKQRH